MTRRETRRASLREAQKAIEAALERRGMVRHDFDAGCEHGMAEAVTIIEQLIEPEA